MSLVNQLALFIDVVQQGSFTKAAALHNMDNSSLSKQIKKLESELGVQLLNRSTRSFSLTPAGEEILEQAHNLRKTVEDVKLIADTYHAEPKGRIRITAPLHIGQQYLQPVINAFMRRYPEVEVTLLMDDKRSDIISEHFDVAFRLGILQDSSLIASKIAEIRPVILASHDFIAQHGEPRSPQELVRLPSVVYSNGSVTIDTVRLGAMSDASDLHSYKMQGRYKVNDVRTLLDAVQAGLGYVMISSSNLTQSVETMNLTPLLTDYRLCNQGTALYALYPHRKQTVLVREFIQAVKAFIGLPPIWEQHIEGFEGMYLGKG